MRTVRVRMYRRNPAKSRRRKKHTRWGAVKAHKRRVNPSRKTQRRKTQRRRNPATSIRQTFKRDTLIRAASLGVGFIAGMQVVQTVTTGTILGRALFTPPAMLSTTLRPGVGLLNVVLGLAIGAKAKKPFARDLALGIVGAGGYDVIRSVVNMAAPGALGLYVNDPMSAIPPASMGLYVNRDTPKPLGRVGKRYSIPTRNLNMNGYEDSAFSDVNSSFAST